ncbi:hypothetical protein [Sorangium sp. So ce124]|uniref:hypothetical protein n=1 Tax=Sorangium sp. So ce124 TaxID=3133280 RepID=UPI003F60D017
MQHVHREEKFLRRAQWRAKALAAYDEAMRDIAAGHFPATADERRCPNCACYSICPAP